MNPIQRRDFLKTTGLGTGTLLFGAPAIVRGQNLNSRINVACIGVGDLDRAFDLLDRAVDEREFLIVTLKFNPIFDAIRNDARFDALLKRVGFPAEPPAPTVEPIEIPTPAR